MKNNLPNFHDHFSDWYNTVVYEAELSDHAPVRGCMVIRPYGYAIWENMKQVLDAEFKAVGVQNAAFPLLIPQSFIQKEADHIEGFAPELAVVTHAGGKPLEESLVVRPTSETIIHHMFGQWMRSWRDLPIKINQWCSVVRWEKRPRPFLRTTEFWWQEGHTAHATKEEASKDALKMHKIYQNFMQNHLAIPVIAAEKPSHERFAGALHTYTLEAFMPDAKALQMGTSHHLAQSFAQSFDMKFQDKEGKLALPHLTSWGVTTRMIGALIMCHGDDNGLKMPPKIAPTQVVIVPILKGSADTQETVLQATRKMEKTLRESNVRVLVDDDTAQTPGAKFYKWELKGVPVRIEIGPRDLEKHTCVLVNRIDRNKTICEWSNLVCMVKEKLHEIQEQLFHNAQARMKAQWKISEEGLDVLGPQLAAGGVFFQVGWSGDDSAIEALKKYSGTIRCILPEKSCEKCFYTGQPSKYDILIAKSY